MDPGPRKLVDAVSSFKVTGKLEVLDKPDFEEKQQVKPGETSVMVKAQKILDTLPKVLITTVQANDVRNVVRRVGRVLYSYEENKQSIQSYQITKGEEKFKVDHQILNKLISLNMDSATDEDDVVLWVNELVSKYNTMVNNTAAELFVSMELYRQDEKNVKTMSSQIRDLSLYENSRIIDVLKITLERNYVYNLFDFVIPPYRIDYTLRGDEFINSIDSTPLRQDVYNYLMKYMIQWYKSEESSEASASRGMNLGGGPSSVTIGGSYTDSNKGSSKYNNYKIINTRCFILWVNEYNTCWGWWKSGHTVRCFCICEISKL